MALAYIFIERRKMRCLMIMVAGLLASMQAIATPKIDVGSMYEYVGKEKRSVVKHVHNRGDSVAYVKVTLREVYFDGKGQEIDKDREDRKEGLLASPSHLIIPSKGHAVVRLIHLGSREHERYYRATFSPVVPKTLDEFKLDENEAEQYQQSFSAGVNLLIAYGAVIIVRPENTRFDTQIMKKNGQYFILNNGNSTVTIPHYSVCVGEKCESGGVSHLRPGQKKAFPVDGKKYKVFLEEGGQSRSVDLDQLT